MKIRWINFICYWVIVISVIVLSTLMLSVNSKDACASIDLDKLVDAVYLAEGGDEASVPYGLIYSSWCMKEKGWCRYYAKEILQIHVARCGDDSGNINGVIRCVGNYYCPPSAHALNHNWVKNVTYFYNN